MKTRPFGNTDLHVSEIGLGCARIGGVFQGESGGFLDLLAFARDAGITFFDTADMYSQGESEKLVGRAFRGRRHDVVIATKAGYCLPAQRRFVAMLKPLLRPLIRRLGIRRDRVPSLVKGTISQDFSAGYLTRAVEASLRRLRTDYVDLLQLHSPPAKIVEHGDWPRALEDLKRAGKVRYYGISCDDVEAGLAALRCPGVSSLQFVVNLLEPGPAEALLPAVRQAGTGVIARECLANGLLIKPSAELELSKYCRTPEEAERRSAALVELRRAAAEKNLALAEYALRFVLELQGVSVTLVGARSAAQLKTLLKSAPAVSRAAAPV